MPQVLPATQTLATLDPHSLHMELTYESRQSLEDSIAGRTDSRVAELYAHENRHFHDLIGTLWGQDYLDLLFQAYDALLTTPGSERNYSLLLKLFDADRAILFPSYYKYVMPAAPRGSADDRWSMSFSSGVRIQPDGRSDDGAPILFVRFDKRAKHVARQPITIGSLLEMRASGVEIGAFARWNDTRPPDEQLVNERLRTGEVLDFLYDPQMTTYSVAGHVAAYFLGDTDVVAMTDAAFKVAEIALNLTGNEFGRLQHPAGFFRELSRERLRGFKAQRDRGYAYAILLAYLRGLATGLVSEAAIETMLKRSGLRPLAQTFDAARTAVERKRTNGLQHPELKAIRDRLVDAGLLLFRRRNFDALALFPAAATDPAPLVMTGEDVAEFHLGVPALSQAQSYFLHDCYSTLRDATRLALRAARGFEFGWTDYVY